MTERPRRALLGYSRRQVDALIEGRDRRIVDQEEELRLLRESLCRTESELAQAWREVADSRSRTEEALATVAIVRERIEAERREAADDAERIRAEARREAEEIREGLSGLAGLRDEMATSIDSTLTRLREMLGSGGKAEKAPEEIADGVIDVDRLVELGIERLGSLGTTVPEEVANGSGNGRLRIEVGPLGDFERLSVFQDIAGELAGEEVAIERFSEGRATLSVSGSDPGSLLRALEERDDLEFTVRSQTDERIVLDLDEE